MPEAPKAKGKFFEWAWTLTFLSPACQSTRERWTTCGSFFLFRYHSLVKLQHQLQQERHRSEAASVTSSTTPSVASATPSVASTAPLITPSNTLSETSSMTQSETPCSEQRCPLCHVVCTSAISLDIHKMTHAEPAERMPNHDAVEKVKFLRQHSKLKRKMKSRNARLRQKSSAHFHSFCPSRSCTGFQVRVVRERVRERVGAGAAHERLPSERSTHRATAEDTHQE